MSLPKLRAIKLVKQFHAILDKRDSHWNITEDAKELAKSAIDMIISEDEPYREFWQAVKEEIDKLPKYAEDIKD